MLACQCTQSAHCSVFFLRGSWPFTAAELPTVSVRCVAQLNVLLWKSFRFQTSQVVATHSNHVVNYRTDTAEWGESPPTKHFVYGLTQQDAHTCSWTGRSARMQWTPICGKSSHRCRSHLHLAVALHTLHNSTAQCAILKILLLAGSWMVGSFPGRQSGTSSAAD